MKPPGIKQSFLQKNAYAYLLAPAFKLTPMSNIVTAQITKSRRPQSGFGIRAMNSNPAPMIITMGASLFPLDTELVLACPDLLPGPWRALLPPSTILVNQ